MLVRSPGDIGAAIRDVRKRHAWTQEDLAKRVGVTARWLRDVEHGKSGAEIGLVLRVLSHLGIHLAILDPAFRYDVTASVPSPGDDDFPDIDEIVKGPKP